MALSEPTPCSPVIVPPMASASRTRPSNAASARRRLSGSSRRKKKQGCRLPSPPCPDSVTSTPCSAPSRCPARTRSASRRIGTQTSSVKCGPLSSWAAMQRAPAGHQRVRLLRVVGHGDVRRPRVGEHRRIPLHVRGRAARTVGLDDDRSGAPRGEPVVREPLHRVDRRPVETSISDGPGRSARSATTPAAAACKRPERRERRQRRVRRRDQPHDDRRHDAEQPLGAHEQPGEVEPGDALGRPAPGAHHRSAGQDDLEAAHVVGRHPVLHAAEPARVGRDVAADRAARGRRRVGWVGEADRRRGGLERRVDDAGADDGEALQLVELVDLVQSLDVEHEGPLGRDRTAGQAGPGALRDHGPARRGGLAQHLDHVGAVAGAHHLERRRSHRAAARSPRRTPRPRPGR